MTNQMASNALRFEVLGPLRAWRGETLLDLGPAQQRAVLAVMLLHANKPLGREQLIDALWGQAAPTYAVNLVQRHASSLRRVLEPDRPPRERSALLTWTDTGYLLKVADDQLDLEVFEREIGRARRARAAGDVSGTAEALHAALRLWRGPACDGLVAPLIDAERERLAEQRIAALEDRMDVDLALGGHRELVPELRQLVAQYPFRERLRGLLMLALYRSGRQAEASGAFHEARRHLRDELGMAPSAQVQRLHEQILAADPTLDARTINSSIPADLELEDLRRPPIPAQLPHGMADFVGRQGEIKLLNALIPSEGHSRSGVVIAGIAGTAGVGKTALAVHWAHLIRDRFPDGQLYVNLRGFDPIGSAMDPAEAIRGFLDAFGVPPQQLPVGLAPQAALYRSLLADRRVLVVLDNARDAEQVRPLLPGSSGCLVVVTSRTRLTGLVASEGAYPLTVDLLSHGAARELLSSRLGAARVASEPEAVDDIISACAGLPLALTIVAARAATNPQFALVTFTRELRHARGGLDLLADGGDATIDVRAAFMCSYRTLSAAAARLFRLLGLHAGPDIAVGASASLAGVTVERVRPVLGELTQAHLIAEHVPGRYTFHDLLRAYAAELVRAHEPEEYRNSLQRVLDHYLHTAHSAALVLDPHRESIPLAPPRRGVTPQSFSHHEQAMAWFTTEHAVLLAAVEQSARTGFDDYSWRLAWTLTDFLIRQGHWHDRTVSQRTALAAAQRLADPSAQAHAHRYLGVAYTRLDHSDEAHTHLRQALELYVLQDDQLGQARVHQSLAVAFGREGRHAEAGKHARQAVDLHRAGGNRAGEAHALNSVGWHLAQLGEHRQALLHCEQALALHQEIGNRHGQAHAWDSLGYAHHHLGHHDRAVTCYREALVLYRELGDRYYESGTLTRLGDTYHDSRRPDSARVAWQSALDSLTQLVHADADLVRARLGRLKRHRSPVLGSSAVVAAT